MSRRPALILLTALAACRAPAPAPQDLDGLLHFYWDGFDGAETRDVAAALASLDEAVPHGDLAFRGAQTRLVPAQVAPLGVAHADQVGSANGFFIITEMACTLDELDQLFIATDQDELHPGSYDGYSRTYLSDLAAYRDRQVETLDWQTTIDASPAGFAYTSELRGGVRWVPGRDPDGVRGPTLLGRTWLTEPAATDDNRRSFTQDYQLDIYYEREPAQSVHVYAIWRAIDMGTLGDQDSAALIAVTLSSSAKWDERVEEHCEALR